MSANDINFDGGGVDSLELANERFGSNDIKSCDAKYTNDNSISNPPYEYLGLETPAFRMVS